jgi:type II secretory pathway pseudopilin PulG
MRLLVRRRARAQGLAEVAVVCSIMSSLAGSGGSAAWSVMAAARQTEARVYMKQIYMAVTMYADDNDGRLPRADLYPDLRRDPQACLRSPKSIRRILSGYAPDAKLWVSSAAPDKFQKAGLTYVWNVGVNGKQLDSLPGRTWLLMDMNAAGYVIPDLIPRADSYLVLYSDGSVKLEHVPPQLVPNADADQLKGAVNPNAGTAGGAGNSGGPGMPGGPGAPGGPGTPGGTAAAPPPDVVVPKDPDADRRQKEEAARRANPDEQDAVNE